VTQPDKVLLTRQLSIQVVSRRQLHTATRTPTDEFGIDGGIQDRS
jgi:hypothetical protein